MKYDIIINPSAEDDILSAFKWYEKEHKGLGSEYIDALDGVLENISGNPQLYQVRYREVRMAVVSRFPFVIHYIIDQTRVYVLAVMHTKRKPRS